MISISLDEGDVIRLKEIVIDGDERDALAFVRERIYSRLEQQDPRMKSALDGGKGSTL